MTPNHNLNALLVGTGEFRFCPGATSAIDARTKGYRDVGNITAYTPETDNKLEEHEGSYRGRKIIDKKFCTSMKLEYVLTVDEHKKSNLKLLFVAQDGSEFTQSVHTLAEIDTLDFTSDLKSAADRWYDIFDGGDRLRALTSCVFATAPAVSVTADSGTHFITEATHGRSNGDAVVLSGTAVPTGTSAGTVYYVANKTSGTYQLAATPVGTADPRLDVIAFSSTGTDVKVRAVLTEGVDCQTDLALGSVRFLTQRATNVTPIVSCPVIAVGDPNYYFGIQPMKEPIVTGYGRLILYDQDDDNIVVMDHQDFSCIVTAEKSKAIDGKKVTDFTVRVTVTLDSGNLLVRNDNDEPA
jgi:hypothetical protein